jgi:hypothetical protein
MIPLWKGKNPIYFGVIRAKVKVTYYIVIKFKFAEIPVFMQLIQSYLFVRVLINERKISQSADFNLRLSPYMYKTKFP